MIAPTPYVRDPTLSVSPLTYLRARVCLSTAIVLQVYILTGIPAFFLRFGGARADDRRRRIYASSAAIVRVILLWVAILYTPSTHVRAIAAIAGAAVYLAEIVFTVVRKSMARSRNNGKPLVLTASDQFLYVGAHVSIINFVSGMCINHMKNIKLQRYITTFANVSIISILYVGYRFMEPYARAWMCYPKHERWPSRLNRGMCPQWEQYYTAPGHENSNAGDVNLICSEVRFGSNGFSEACTTLTIDTSMPVWWHMVSTIFVAVFTLTLSLSGIRFREIMRLESKS